MEVIIGKGSGMKAKQNQTGFCINNKVLPYSTGNYIQSPGIDQDGKEYKKKNMYDYVALRYSRN